MKSFLKILMTTVIALILSGCSTHDVSDVVDNALVATSGNKPPKFFAFASPYRANGYIMHHKDFTFMMPLTKEKDWNKMSGWSGAYIYGGIGIGVDNPDVKKVGSILGYGFNFSTSISKYGERAKATETRDQNYIKMIRKKYQYKKDSKVYFETHGKENYSCIVNEVINPKRSLPGVRTKSYGCYKFNPTKTMYKKVGITLVYTKSSTLPSKYKTLAKEYTYQDLQNRAKRVLDSLYIKDGWNK